MLNGKTLAAGGLITGLLLLAGVYYMVDPAGVSWMPRCPLRLITGLDCPGCGSQRMLHALLHGDIPAAFHANAFLLCSLPIIIFLIILEFLQRVNPAKHTTLYRHVYGPATAPAAAVLLIGWFVARNFLI